ncbi:hypothetical protein [Sphaerisporangium corydalis]|uniref:Uncharacterized protein n=1 Tax=Sphaerisporangium corydalis TaxID=1441875 RepID=A0ABV9E8X0_9ACTN|nr:hypothetical protein [Sphaerisporangium corydalis]
MAHLDATHPKEPIPGWRIFRSDQGRLWATRERPYNETAEKAGAWRTVDADDEPGLCRAIAEQESVAEMGPVTAT